MSAFYMDPEDSLPLS